MMAQNFSVEWLSTSFYTSPNEQVVEKTESGLNITSSAMNWSRDTVLQANTPRPMSHIEIEEFAKDSGNKYIPTSPNNSCGYTSCSESEVGDESEGESAQRRLRTKFTSDQICKLEKTFNKHKYLGATQRKKIAEKLFLSETQIKTWFQNRRMKVKRDVQNARSEFFSAHGNLLSPFMCSTPSFQHHYLNGQLPVYYQTAQATYPQSLQQATFPTQHVFGPQHMQHPPGVMVPSYY